MPPVCERVSFCCNGQLKNNEQNDNLSKYLTFIFISKRRLAPVSFRPLQLLGNILVHDCITCCWLTRLLLRCSELRSLQHLCLSYAHHVFGITDDVWNASVNGTSSATLVLCLCFFCLLLSHSHFILSSFCLFLFHCLHKRLISFVQLYLPPFALLRNWLGALLQQVNCSSFTFCTKKTIFKVSIVNMRY